MAVPWFNIVVAIAVGVGGGVYFWRPFFIELNEKQKNNNNNNNNNNSNNNRSSSTTKEE